MLVGMHCGVPGKLGSNVKLEPVDSSGIGEAGLFDKAFYFFVVDSAGIAKADYSPAGGML